MNRTSIKIIKRKDAQVGSIDKTPDLFGPKLVAATSGDKTELCLHRTMAKTVSNWIAERRENNRTEEVSALRTMFGTESFVSETA